MAAQRYLSTCFDLREAGQLGVHNIDHQEQQSLRKALSLRVRGRNVDQNLQNRALAGLAKIPVQVRNGTCYPTISEPKMLIVERIARFYEAEECNEDGDGV